MHYEIFPKNPKQHRTLSPTINLIKLIAENLVRNVQTKCWCWPMELRRATNSWRSAALCYNKTLIHHHHHLQRDPSSTQIHPTQRSSAYGHANVVILSLAHRSTMYLDKDTLRIKMRMITTMTTAAVKRLRCPEQDPSSIRVESWYKQLFCRRRHIHFCVGDRQYRPTTENGKAVVDVVKR